MKIIFIGLPGCGKTTQAKRLSQYLGISYVSMRQLVQDSGLTNSKSWQPLSDNLAVQICGKAIADKSDFILDGFPRNKEQLQELEIEDSVIIFLDISFEESERRMLKRGDKKEAIANRVTLERQRFPGLIKSIPRYKWDGGLAEIVIKINGEKSLDAITSEITNHPIIWFMGLSEEVQNKLLYFYDPYDGCFGSIFNLNNPEYAVNKLREELRNEI